MVTIGVNPEQPNTYNVTTLDPLSARIRLARRRVKKTLKQVAAQVDVAYPQVVIRWEKGTREPGLQTLKLLAQCLSTSVAYLVGEVDDPRPISEWLPPLLSMNKPNVPEALREIQRIRQELDRIEDLLKQ